MADRDRFGGSAMSYSRPGDSSSYGDYLKRGLGPYRPPGTIGSPPIPGETGRSLGPAGGPLPPTGRSLRDIFTKQPKFKSPIPLPHATPTYMVDQITDALGIGDRRKERYIAATQGGYPNVSMRKGIGSLMPDYDTMPYEQEEAAVDPSDWRVIQQILNAGGDPDDYVQTAGIMGAMPEERQMAELTQDQMNMMGNPLNTPDFGVSKEDLWNRTKDMEDQGFFGWGAQEPTTREEFEDYYRQLQAGTAGNWVT